MQGRETTEDKARRPPASQRLGSNQHLPGEHLYFQGSPTMDLGRGPGSPLPAMG